MILNLGRRRFVSRAWHCSSPPWPVIWLDPSCHLCAAVARPSLAGYRLEPPPLPPRRPRTGSRHAAIVYPRRLNAFVSPDAKTTHSFRAPAPPRPAAAAPRGAAHQPTRSRPSHYTFTTLPLRRPPQTEPNYRHYSDRSGAQPVAFHNKMFIFNNCRQIPDPQAARAYKFSRCILVWKLPLCYLTIRFNSKYISHGHNDFDFVNTAYEVIFTIYLHAEMQWNRLVISCKMHFRIARL